MNDLVPEDCPNPESNPNFPIWLESHCAHWWGARNWEEGKCCYCGQVGMDVSTRHYTTLAQDWEELKANFRELGRTIMEVWRRI